MAREPLGPDEVGEHVRLDLGPVSRASALAWIAWADEFFGELRNGPSGASSCAELLCGAGGYLEQWKCAGHSMAGSFRWKAEADPDELEYLIHCFLSLDAQLPPVERNWRSPTSGDARDFYVVMVRDLLRALETEGASRAAFVDQLRAHWPCAAEVS